MCKFPNAWHGEGVCKRSAFREEIMKMHQEQRIHHRFLLIMIDEFLLDLIGILLLDITDLTHNMVA